MALSNVFEKLGRAVFESPFGANRLAKDAPELAEIRLAALDAVKAKSHRVSGKHVFPYDLIRIELLGIPEEQAQVFENKFLSGYFAEELKAGLTRSSYRFPAELSVEFGTSPLLPEKGGSWLSVETSMRQSTAVPTSNHNASIGWLTVTHGTANQMKLMLKKARTNIGRTAEVFRTAGPSRRNDLVFVGDDEIDKTVSREHAHVLRSSTTGEYRLFNDRVYKGDDQCGLWIVRDGLSLPVHKSPRGTLLQSGDEIYIGTAMLRFSVEKR